MRKFSHLGVFLVGALTLLSGASTVQADIQRHGETEFVEHWRKAARLTPNFQPKAAGVQATDQGLTLASGDRSAAAVNQAVTASQPPLDFGQFFKDIIPKNNYSAALDKACNAIHTQLPTIEYYGRTPVNISLAPNYTAATGEYYNARQAANRPACVVFPTSANDISSIMKNLRKYDAIYAVRAAGHSTGYDFSNAHGFSSTTGVLIDMRKMRAVSYNKSTGIARWEPGQNWGQLATTMNQYGAQVTGGRLAHVGPGLTFGGGLSFFSGQVGFASDTTTAFEMVLADGSIVTATRTNKYKDLWWAQKTGLNAFGIVTAVHSETLPIPAGGYFGGTVLFDPKNVDGIMGALADWYQNRADRCAKGFVLPAFTYFLVESTLTQVFLFEFIFDGPNPGDCFDEFWKFPASQNDTKVQSFPDFLIKSLTNQDFIFKGFNQAYYSAVMDTPTKETLLNVYNSWVNTTLSVSGTFLNKALSFSPVTKSHLAKHKAAGGSALGIENETRGFIWPCYVDGSIPAIGTLTDSRLFESSAIAAKAVPAPVDRTLPIYINNARYEQKPLLTFRPESLAKYRQIKQKYDPDNFITTHTTGHAFY